jgi:hypothetical protein
VFSRSTTSPFCIAATAAFAFSPTTLSSFAKTTSLPSNSESLFATGAKESSGFTSPLGLPMCEQRITLAPSSISFLMVGKAAVILFSSVITPSLRGTLKSHLTNTRFPVTLRSSTVFLFSICPAPFFIRYGCRCFCRQNCLFSFPESSLYYESNCSLIGTKNVPQKLLYDKIYFPASLNISKAAPSSVTKMPLGMLWLTESRLSAFFLPPATKIMQSILSISLKSIPIERVS